MATPARLSRILSSDFPCQGHPNGDAPPRGDATGVPMKISLGVPSDSEIVFLATQGEPSWLKHVETTTWQQLDNQYLLTKQETRRDHSLDIRLCQFERLVLISPTHLSLNHNGSQRQNNISIKLSDSVVFTHSAFCADHKLLNCRWQDVASYSKLVDFLPAMCHEKSDSPMILVVHSCASIPSQSSTHPKELPSPILSPVF